jgi:hypothetical protein
MGDASASTFVWRARTLRGCAGRGNRMGGPRWSRVSCHQTERAASAELKPQATCAFPRIAEVAPPSSPGPTDDGVWKRYADRGRRTHPTFETDMTLAAGQEMPDSRQLLMRPVIRRCCRSISSMERLARCSTESDGCRSAGSRRDSAVGSPGGVARVKSDVADGVAARPWHVLPRSRRAHPDQECPDVRQGFVESASNDRRRASRSPLIGETRVEVDNREWCHP